MMKHCFKNLMKQKFMRNWLYIEVQILYKSDYFPSDPQNKII